MTTRLSGALVVLALTLVTGCGGDDPRAQACEDGIDLAASALRQFTNGTADRAVMDQYGAELTQVGDRVRDEDEDLSVLLYDLARSVNQLAGFTAPGTNVGPSVDRTNRNLGEQIDRFGELCG